MMMRRLLLACVLMPTAAFAAEWFTPHAYYSFDIVSCYISRGKVYEDQPIQSNEVDIHFDLSKYGRIGFYHWDYSCLTGKYQDRYRRFIPETDWAVYYEFDIPIVERWVLTTQLMTEWKTYHGGKPESDPTSLDWRLKQTLKNPYVSPYYKVHFTSQPVQWWYYQIGFKRTFNVCKNFTLTPHAAMDFADGEGRIKRFGARPDGAPYGAGVVSMFIELLAEYAFTDWFSVHAIVGQFDVIDTGGRDNLEEPHQRDITYAQVGFKLEY